MFTLYRGLLTEAREAAGAETIFGITAAIEKIKREGMPAPTPAPLDPCLYDLIQRLEVDLAQGAHSPFYLPTTMQNALLKLLKSHV
jgi:hypothetical protein